MGFHAFKEGRETSIAEMGLKWEGARRVGGGHMKSGNMAENEAEVQKVQGRGFSYLPHLRSNGRSLRG